MTVAGIVIFWVLFAGSHILLSSSRLRRRLVGVLGDQGFQGVYSLVALSTFVPLCWLYAGAKHSGPQLWYLGYMPAVRWIGYLGMGVALALVVAGMMKPSPASAFPGKNEVSGVHRVTRHPVFMGIGLFGLVHLLVANVSLAELCFFSGFPIFALLGNWHQDARKLVLLGEDYQRFHAHTPFLPFTGSGTLQGLREMALPVSIAVGVAVLLRFLHPILFGGA